MSEPPFLRVTSIQVKGLFGYYNHLVKLNPADRVTIIHGPNGIGKTKLLQMVSWLLAGNLKPFVGVPFESFEVKFSNGAELSVVHSKMIDVKLVDPITGELRDRLPKQKFLNMFPDEGWEASEWLLNHNRQVHCVFIETQRLLRFDYPDDSTDISQQRERIDRVEDVAKDLARLVSETMASYGRESQVLDQSYPQRVLAKKRGGPVLGVEELKQRLQALDRTQNALKELGLLNQADAAPPDLSDLAALDETERRAMTLYVTDTEKKLAVLSDFAQRVRLLLQVSPKFLRKRIRLDREKGLIAENDRGQPLALDMLSSGEQHELVLHFDLLFRIKPNTLVLIDEPELSLHVTWQKQFLPNLLEITRTVGIDVVVATHSPFIIGDRADLMVALEDEIG